MMMGTGKFFILAMLAAGLLQACTTANVDIRYESNAEVADVEKSDQAKIVIGQFVDRRGRGSDKVGEILGKYYFPKVNLRTSAPVSLVVRNLVEEAAKERGMLRQTQEPATYQLYGHINELNGRAAKPAGATVDLVVRLFDLEEGEEVYQSNHQVQLDDVPVHHSPQILGEFVKDAINQAVADMLDSPDLQDVLRGDQSS